MKKTSTKIEKLLIVGKKGMIVVPLSKILYFKKCKHKTQVIISKKESYEITESLKKLEDILPSYFFRCHNSLLVNLHYIKEFQNSTNNCIILENNMFINISRHRKQEFEEKLKEMMYCVE